MNHNFTIIIGTGFPNQKLHPWDDCQRVSQILGENCLNAGVYQEVNGWDEEGVEVAQDHEGLLGVGKEVERWDLA